MCNLEIAARLRVMSAMNRASAERVGQIRERVNEAKGSRAGLDTTAMLADMEFLLAMIEEPEEPQVQGVDLDRPRVWLGPQAMALSLHWWWDPQECHWNQGRCERLRDGDIFVAGCQRRPSVAPGPVSGLEICYEVDWVMGPVV